MNHNNTNPDDLTESEREYFYSRRREDGDIEPMKQFYRLDTPHPSQMEYMVLQMKKTLFGLVDGSIPNNTNYTIDELYEYSKSLIEGQAKDHIPSKKEKGGWTLKRWNWSLTSDISGMPFDARVWYIQNPTYIAVATLSRILLDFPEIALKIEPYFRVMKTGFNFSAKSGLRGAGYEVINTMLDNLEIFCKGGVPKVLNEYPIVASPRLKKLLDLIEKTMIEDFENIPTTSDWVNRERYDSVLKMLADAKK